MEVVIFLLILFALAIIYFIAGMAIKLIWGWFPLVVALVLFIVGGYNWIGGIAILVALVISDWWQGTEAYFKVEERMDKLFWTKD